MAETRKPISILHLGKFYWPHHGGMETSLQQLTEAGTKLGHQVAVWVSQSKNIPSQQELIHQADIFRFRNIGTLFSTPLNPGLLLKKTPAADIFHVHLPHPIAELKTLWILATKNIRCIPYLHAFPTNQGILGKVWFKFITTPILKKAESILISNEGLLTLIPQLKEFTDKIKILPFSTECISETELQNWFIQREKNKNLLAVGRMVPYKGFDLLLQAWKRLLTTHPEYQDWKLTLIGDGPEYSTLRSLAQNIPPQNIRFVGSCDDSTKKQYLKDATAYVLSSVSTAETFGISLLEAFGKGLPAVVSNLPGGVKKLARDGACGSTYEATSVPALTEALNSILKSASLRETAGRSNLQFARDFYSENQLLSLYGKVIHER